MRIKIQQMLLLLLVLSAVLVSCDKITTDPQEQCAMPVLTPAGGIYTESQSVSITCSTAGASIRYTIDGTNPTSSSTIYTNPINLTETRTIKAIAFKDGWSDSQVAAATFAIEIPEIQTVAVPVFNPPGGTYSSSLTVSISCVTPGATIRYTIDGSEPDSLSAIYANPMIVTSAATIKARSFKPGWISSQVVTASYAIELLTVATPVFAPSGGNYISGIAVSIKCATPGATIRFTSDGSNPNASSTLYTSSINVSASTTLKAKAFKAELQDSKTVTAAYVIQAATPVITPAGGTYNTNQYVTISCSTNGAIIRYTTNGTNPTSSSTTYSTPIYVSASTTLKAKAFKAELQDSKTVTVAYVIQAATPVITPAGGIYNTNQNVTISCSTNGTIIRYTTNGTDPTASSTVYSTPIYVSSSLTVKAKAFKTGLSDSQTARESYTINIPIPSDFVLIPGGTFNNGTSDVTVSSIYLGIHEVTQSSFQAVMEVNPSLFTNVTNGPVERVSWLTTIEYCNRRSINEELNPCYSYANYGTNPDNWPTGWNEYATNHINISCNWEANGYRLPTEAEWQYAAMAANETPNFIYSGSNDINAVAWYNGNSGGVSHSVGLKAPNALGLYDMTGNVWECVWDIWGPYPTAAQVNPHGPSNGPGRIDRGGGWNNISTASCTVSSRTYNSAIYDSGYLGFRLCKNAN